MMRWNGGLAPPPLKMVLSRNWLVPGVMYPGRGVALPVLPNTVPVPREKFGWLKAFHNSMRNCRNRPSPATAKFLKKARFHVLIPGESQELRPQLVWAPSPARMTRAVGSLG